MWVWRGCKIFVKQLHASEAPLTMQGFSVRKRITHPVIAR